MQVLPCDKWEDDSTVWIYNSLWVQDPPSDRQEDDSLLNTRFSLSAGSTKWRIRTVCNHDYIDYQGISTRKVNSKLIFNQWHHLSFYISLKGVIFHSCKGIMSHFLRGIILHDYFYRPQSHLHGLNAYFSLKGICIPQRRILHASKALFKLCDLKDIFCTPQRHISHASKALRELCRLKGIFTRLKGTIWII